MELTTQPLSQREPHAQPDYILVVDDLEDNRFLLQVILEAEGYNVKTAINGTTALEQAEALPPTLMLLDVMMPDMSGYEVTRRIRRSTKIASLPIVLITAHGKESAMLGKAVGADDFISKPFDFDELIQRIRTYTV